MGALTYTLPANIPSEYAYLAEVFSKQGAATMPPHLPYDCAIKLHSGTVPPRGSYILFQLLRVPQ